MKRASDCAFPSDPKAASHSNYGSRHGGGRYAAKTKKKRKNLLLLLVVSALVIVLALLGAYLLLSAKTARTDSYTHLNPEVDNGCVIIRQHPVVMQDGVSGSCELDVSLPDYVRIFANAFTTTDPKGYVAAVLDSGKYDRVNRTVAARVTVENGSTVIHTDEAITALLEVELSKAISDMMEVQ